MKNANSAAVSVARKGGAYTPLPGDEREVQRYRPYIEDKIVYCDCEDPRVSNFLHYFSRNFGQLGLRKLVTTC